MEKADKPLEDRIDPEMDRKIAERHKDIPGWGIDADPENDPTYPIKKRTGADYERIHYEKAPQQEVDIEVLHSIERPGITRVFGTSTPPSGVSGMIRRAAYKYYSENHPLHWMTLILADRVNVVEGIVEDFGNGIVPNIFAEKGWGAEWKYNRTRAITKIAVTAVTVAAVVAMVTRKKKRKLV